MAAPDPPPGPRAEGSGSGASGSSLPATLAARVEEIIRAAEREAEAIQHDLDAHREAAEAEAQRYVEDVKRQADALMQRRIQRMRELTDELIERAEATHRHVDALIGALDRATAKLSEEDIPLSPLPPAQPQSQTERSPGPGQAPASARPAPEDAAPASKDEAPPGRPSPAATPAPSKPRAAPASPAKQAPEPAGGRVSAPAADAEAARLVAIEMAVAGRTRGEVDSHLREAFGVTNTTELLNDVFGGGDAESDRRGWVTP